MAERTPITTKYLGLSILLLSFWRRVSSTHLGENKNLGPHRYVIVPNDLPTLWRGAGTTTPNLPPKLLEFLSTTYAKPVLAEDFLAYLAGGTLFIQDIVFLDALWLRSFTLNVNTVDTLNAVPAPPAVVMALNGGTTLLGGRLIRRRRFA